MQNLTISWSMPFRNYSKFESIVCYLWDPTAWNAYFSTYLRPNNTHGFQSRLDNYDLLATFRLDHFCLFNQNSQEAAHNNTFVQRLVSGIPIILCFSNILNSVLHYGLACWDCVIIFNGPLLFLKPLTTAFSFIPNIKVHLVNIPSSARLHLFVRYVG